MLTKVLENKIDLAMLPTPLQRLDPVRRYVGSEIWIKRDDLTGSQLSGNKIRKLEYLLKEAIDNGHKMIITCGGEQSNHCRTTALAARSLGLPSHLVLRKTGEGPTGNWLLDILAGATFKWISSEEYPERDAIMQSESDKFHKENPYIIPEGGSNPTGVLGYIAAGIEIAEQAKQLGKYPENIAVAVGTTGTLVGLAIGFAMEGLDTKVLGISTGDKAEVFMDRAEKLALETISKYSLNITPDDLNYEISDDFVGDGYGIADCDTAEYMMKFALDTGIILDITYTAKGFMGGLELFPKTKKENGINILLHTGGIFGIFSKGQIFRELYFGMMNMKSK